MKIYFENIAPFERRVSLDLKLFNIIQYKNNNLSLALQRALNMLGAGDYTGWEGIPIIHTELGKLKRYMLDPNKPVKVGIERNHVFGPSQADFVYTWDSELNHARVTEFKLKFNNHLVYHRKEWKAKLHIKGLLEYIGARNTHFQKEAQKQSPEEKEQNDVYGENEKLELYQQILNLPKQTYAITVTPDKNKDIPFSHIFPSSCFNFFKEESQYDFNFELENSLRELACDVPYGSHNHWFRFDLKDALSFADLKLETTYDRYQDLDLPEVQLHLNRICKNAKIPVPKKELVFDNSGAFIGRRFVIVNKDGVKQNISDLSNEEQAIYYLVSRLCIFGYWTYDGLTYYDDERIVDLSGLENFLSLDELFIFMAYIKLVFNHFRFVLTTKNNFVLRAFTMWTKQQELPHTLFNIYRFKNNETKNPIEKLTLRSDYEINFAVIDTHDTLRRPSLYN